MSSVTQHGPIPLGLDVHKNSISVAVLAWGQDTAEVDKICHDEPSVRRLIARFDDPAQLRACYEAGPTGYELQRLLAGMRVRCDVVAPALIPRAPGDRVKTDRRDARRLARLHRAGELVAIRVPSVVEEAVRDLGRARLRRGWGGAGQGAARVGEARGERGSQERDVPAIPGASGVLSRGAGGHVGADEPPEELVQ
jgi:Transposase